MEDISELLKTRAICETDYTYVLFHGTPVNFDHVDISKSNAYTDFGKGFYLTSIFEQAVEWAGMKRKRLTEVEVSPKKIWKFSFPLTYVLKFELSLEKLKKMNYIIYEGYTKEWLRKVSVCRDRRLSEDNQAIKKCDVTIGPMADNHVGEVLAKYWMGEYDEEETLKFIQLRRPNMQIAFHTERSLEAIKLINNTLQIQ